MNINYKVVFGSIYVLCLGIFLFFVFSYLDFKDLTNYSYIRDNTKELLDFKNNNYFLLVLLFSIFSIIWIIFLGFGSPLAIISGFVFGKWIGTIISVISFSIGCTLLYIIASIYFRDLIIKHLEKKIYKFKSLFRKNEFFYFMVFRFCGGGGIPFGLQNVLPVIFDMSKKNYFYSTFLGLIPTLLIINSLGSGIENLIDKNINLTFKDIIFDPGIYWPILIFLLFLLISIFIKGKLFKGDNNENKKS